MRAPTVYSDVCLALMRIGTRMATGFDQHFTELNLTQAQFRLLLAAWELGQQAGAPPSHLADHLLIERATVSTLSQTLVKRGLLERRPGANRRSHRLAVTRSGAAMLENAIPNALRLAQDTLQGLSDRQLKTMLTNLQRIENQMRIYKDKKATPR